MLSHAGQFHIAPGTDRQTLSPPSFVRQMIHRLHAQFMRVGRLSCERTLRRVDALICTVCKCFRKFSGIEQGDARGCVLGASSTFIFLLSVELELCLIMYFIKSNSAIAMSLTVMLQWDLEQTGGIYGRLQQQTKTDFGCES